MRVLSQLSNDNEIPTQAVCPDLENVLSNLFIKTRPSRGWAAPQAPAAHYLATINPRWTRPWGAIFTFSRLWPVIDDGWVQGQVLHGVSHCSWWRKSSALLYRDQSHGMVLEILAWMSALPGAYCKCAYELLSHIPCSAGQLWLWSLGSSAVGVRGHHLISGWVSRQLLASKASSCLHISW